MMRIEGASDSRLSDALFSGTFPYEGGTMETLRYCTADGWDKLYEALDQAAGGLCGRKILIVSDARVYALYAKQVEDSLLSAAAEDGNMLQVYHCVIPEGETHKDLASVCLIYDALLAHGFERQDLTAALGGGVTGDIAGYAAATYKRGIRCVQMPTTLLAMVDSSIGGKTAVDYGGYKNMIGAFHAPVLTYTALPVLKTLPVLHLQNGMAEILKSALLDSEDFLAQVSAFANGFFDGCMDHRQEELSSLIRRTAAFKSDVVRRDPKEQGHRMILNFGHTIGHAIEAEHAYAMPHGFCVAIGMAGALKLSVSRGLMKQETADAVTELILKFGLPVSDPQICPEKILLNMKQDKKADCGKIRMVLLKAPGKPVICDDLSDAELISVLDTLK